MQSIETKGTEQKEKIPELLNAEEMRDATREPQIKRLIREIYAAMEKGEESCYLSVGGRTPIRQDILEIFLEKGYDISYSSVGRGKEESWFYKIFWNEGTSGKMIKEEKFF